MIIETVWQHRLAYPFMLMNTETRIGYRLAGRFTPTRDSKEWTPRGGYFRSVNGFRFSVIQNKYHTRGGGTPMNNYWHRKSVH